MELLCCLAIVAAAAGWGALLASRSEPITGERLFVETGLGLAILSQLVVLLGFLGELRAGLLLALVYGGALPGWAFLLGRARARSEASTVSRVPAARWAAAGTGLLVLLSVWRALESDRAFDRYHAFLPKAYLLEHGIAPFAGALETTLFLNVEMLNVVAFAHGTGQQPAVLSALYFGLAAWGAFLLLRDRESPAAGILAACCLVGNPLLARSAGLSVIECGQALFGMAFLAAGLGLLERGGTRRAVETAILGGVLIGTKETSPVLLVLPAAGFLLVRWRAERPRRVRPGALVAVAAGAVALASVWLVRKWLATGNPFYPFFVDRIATRPEFLGYAQFFRGLNRIPGAGEVGAVFEGLADVIRDDSLEPLVGIAALALLAIAPARRRFGPWLVLAALTLGASAATLGGARVVRYVGPPMAFFGLAAGVLLAALLERYSDPRHRRAGLAVLALGLLVRHPFAVQDLYARPSDLLALPPLTFRQRLARVIGRSPGLAIIPKVNEALGRGDRLLVVGAPLPLEYLDVPFVPPSIFQRDFRYLYRDEKGTEGRSINHVLVFPPHLPEEKPFLEVGGATLARWGGPSGRRSGGAGP